MYALDLFSLSALFGRVIPLQKTLQTTRQKPPNSRPAASSIEGAPLFANSFANSGLQCFQPRPRSSAPRDCWRMQCLRMS
jgi:hypothetical protein